MFVTKHSDQEGNQNFQQNFLYHAHDLSSLSNVWIKKYTKVGIICEDFPLFDKIYCELAAQEITRKLILVIGTLMQTVSLLALKVWSKLVTLCQKFTALLVFHSKTKKFQSMKFCRFFFMAHICAFWQNLEVITSLKL